jgi:hypothetical protein
MSINKFVEAFGFLTHYLGLDESSFYYINGTYLIIYRENDDFTDVEKCRIEEWIEKWIERKGKFFDEYKIEENRITIKNLSWQD